MAMMGRKRCLEMVLYDHAVAAASAAEQQRAVVPYNPAAEEEPADAQPINAVPWRNPRPPGVPAPALSSLGHEPPCLRRHLLSRLNLRADLTMHFIDVKTMTVTDLVGQQSRFRLPTNGVLQRLRPLLTEEELETAKLLYDPEPRAKRPKKLPPPQENDGEAAAAANNQPGPEKTKKKTGERHGGLPVTLVDLTAGVSENLLLSRWESSHGTIVKGKGYVEFIQRCSFKQGDVIEIWAFKQRKFRHFGVTMCHDSDLNLFLVKRDDTPTSCRHCPTLLPVNEA